MKFLLAFFLLATLGIAQDLRIDHVTVIDATGAAPKQDFTVTLRDGKITGLAQTPKSGDSATGAIDGTGKFLIPGLWDMHVHITAPLVQFPLLVANGVTGVREMYSQVSIARQRQWAAMPDAPRVVVSGFTDGPQPRPAGNWPDAYALVDTESAQAAVQLIARQRPDFIKVYSGIPRLAFLALADAARAIGLPFAGHVPEEVSPLEASNAGIRSQEHLNNILLAVSTNEEKLRAQRVATMNHGTITGAARARLLGWPLPDGLFDTYDEKKAAALFQTFVKNQTFQTPTLAVLSGYAHMTDDEFIQDPRHRYIPQSWNDIWNPKTHPLLRDLMPEEYASLNQRMRILLDRYQKLVKDMSRAGVPLLAGTDTNPLNPMLPGWGLHDELALFVEAGLSPLEALQSATRNPARYFGERQQSGTIEIGKTADLVLLDADPLKDIRNTQKISGVILRGLYYSRQDLDVMLQKAADAVR